MTRRKRKRHYRFTEEDLAVWLAGTLRRAGSYCVREVLSDTGRIDLVVRAQHTAAIEIKAAGDRQSLCTALGQALAYKADGYERAAVAIPTTRYISASLLAAYENAAVQLLELAPGTYTAISPAFPNLYGRETGIPWGRVTRPHAHMQYMQRPALPMTEFAQLVEMLEATR